MMERGATARSVHVAPTEYSDDDVEAKRYGGHVYR